MSRFVTTLKHINQITYTLGTCEFSGNGRAHALYNTIYYWDNNKFLRFGRELWILNHKSYRARYKERSGFTPYCMSYGSLTALSPIELLKSMECLAYQCDEAPGDYPVLQQLHNIIDELRKKIVDNMPEYQAAPWGEK